MALDTNLFTNIEATIGDSALPGWTSNGLGGRAATIITGERQFFRTDVDVSGEQCFLIEAVLTAAVPPPPGIEAGARLQVMFDDPNAPNPFEPTHSMRCIQVRLRQDADGTNLRLDLVDGNNETALQSIGLIWTSAYRVRLMRQKVDGVYQIVMEAEPEANWDPTGTLSVAEPFASFSVLQPLSGFTAEFRFGNFLGLSTNSDWKSIHVSKCDDDATALPYWPPVPAKPTLTPPAVPLASPDPANQQVLVTGSYAGGFTGNTDTPPVADTPDRLEFHLKSTPVAEQDHGTISADPENFTDAPMDDVPHQQTGITGFVRAIEASGRFMDSVDSDPIDIPEVQVEFAVRNQSDILVDHDNSDLNVNYTADSNQGALDKTLWRGVGEHNHMGVRLQNLGNAVADCSYRLLCVPNSLFSDTTKWKLINYYALAGVDKTAVAVDPSVDNGFALTGTTDYATGHNHFPSEADFGAEPHTCICALVHSTWDKLEIAGETIDDGWFTDDTLFRDEVLTRIKNNGYWATVGTNTKVANSNFNIKVAVSGKSSSSIEPPPGKFDIWPTPNFFEFGKATALKQLETKDGKNAALPLEELVKAHRKVDADDASPVTEARLQPAGFEYAPWLYEKDHGWTPATERKDPRPALFDPVYYRESQSLVVCGVKNKPSSAIVVNRRQFPTKARVFAIVPTGILPKAHRKAILRVKKPQTPWKGVEVVSVHDFNALFEKRLGRSNSRVILEVTGKKKVTIDKLELPLRDVKVEFHYAVLSEALAAKTPYVLHLEQTANKKVVGVFDLLLRSYHAYDVPLVADQRTKTVYRRNAAEVAAISPGDLVFFETKRAALAGGYCLAPRQFREPLGPNVANRHMSKKTLELFNAARTAKSLLNRLTRDVVDVVREQTGVKPQRGKNITEKTAQRIIDSRRKASRKRFDALQELDAIRGLGGAMLSDVLLAFWLKQKVTRRKKWQPKPAVVELLRPSKRLAGVMAKMSK